MRSAIDHLVRLAMRFRYPVSLPEDVARALGVEISNFVTFEDFVEQITQHQCCPSRLTKFMPREKAELAFTTALHKERFGDRTLCSYFFNEGWIEFDLRFDNESRLRRIYLQHKEIAADEGIEISLIQK